MSNSTISVFELKHQPEDKVKKGVAYACRLLAVREYSINAITLKLKIKDYSQQEIDLIILYLVENNWLCERRYCESLIRSRSNKGQGLSRIKYELSQNLIPERLVKEVLALLAIGWQQVCDVVTEKKITTGSFERSMKDRHKLERFLIYRGFSRSEARSSIEQYLKD